MFDISPADGKDRLGHRHNICLAVTTLKQCNPQQIAAGVYPGVLGRSPVGCRSYKQDTQSKQTQDQPKARMQLLEEITGSSILASAVWSF